jgi:hypothetical protein
MTKVQWSRTKNRVTDRELVLVSPKTGMLLQVQLPPDVMESSRQVMQEIVDHMNETMGLE